MSRSIVITVFLAGLAAIFLAFSATPSRAIVAINQPFTLTSPDIKTKKPSRPNSSFLDLAAPEATSPPNWNGAARRQKPSILP